MNVKFVIPSYNRSDLIKKKTLSLCKRLNINFNDIYVFIIKEDEDNYKNSLCDLRINIIVVDIPSGLHHMRNYITKYFPEKTLLLSLDDDINDIYKLVNDNTLTQITSSEFNTFLYDSFQICLDNSIGLFGVYPVKNAYFMKDSPEKTYKLKFCVGAFWGCINNHNIHINIEEKEDFERTIQFYIENNKILRINNICVATNYYKNKGGMQTNTNRIENSKISSEYLIRTYPKYCKFNRIKKSGIHEIKLRIVD